MSARSVVICLGVAIRPLTDPLADTAPTILIDLS